MLLSIVLAPFVAALLVPWLRRVAGSWIGLFLTIIPASLFTVLLSILPRVNSGTTISAAWEWVSSLGINFALRLDSWSLLFALLVTGIGTLVFLYSHFYLGAKEDLTKYYLYILAFMGSMLGVVLAGNLIVLYLFWEFTSFTSFLLIGFWSNRERSRYGAQKALLITVFGGFVMLAGFALLYIVTGSFDLVEIMAKRELVLGSPLFPYILILVLIGAFTKSAQVPFHIWLPNAMEAPTPISAFLHSATMVKAGLYLVGRLFPLFSGTALWFGLVSGVGVATLITGSLLAVKQDDLKALLAYSTISQLWLIMTLFGLGTPLATSAAVFHLFNHAAFKGALFMAVGIIDHETGTRDINLLGGLGKRMPITAAVTGIAAFAMAGLPPFSGFVSKELFYEATLHPEFSGWLAGLLPWLSVGASIFTFVYSMLLFFYVFLGQPRGETPKLPHEAPILMLIGPVVLAGITIFAGLKPDFFGQSLVNPAVASIIGRPVSEHYQLWHGVTTPLVMSLATIGVGVVLYKLVEPLRRLFKGIKTKFNPNHIYDWGLDLLTNQSAKLTNWYMTGLLRDYVVYIIGAFVILVGGTYLLKVSGIQGWHFAPINLYELLFALLFAAAVIMILRASSRVIGLIALGIVGFFMASFWVILRAPDLALTQLIVETISLILFLLAFAHLPSYFKDTEPRNKKIVDAITSASFGILAAGLALTAHGTRLFESISAYYIENSLKLGGGRNIVNVILVDFRGLDTMGEITVLSIAAMGVYALVKLRRRTR